MGPKGKLLILQACPPTEPTQGDVGSGIRSNGTRRVAKSCLYIICKIKLFVI